MKSVSMDVVCKSKPMCFEMLMMLRLYIKKHGVSAFNAAEYRTWKQDLLFRVLQENTPDRKVGMDYTTLRLNI